MSKKIYLGGDIMSFGSNLARQYEYKKFMEADRGYDVYSPVKNKSINDKANMTEEENNHLAEKITKADIDRLWESDTTVMEPVQSAIGSLCETGTLYGWKYMCDQLKKTFNKVLDDTKDKSAAYEAVMDEIDRVAAKENYFHYFDIRTNHLNEKDWRRSFSINQLLYGMVLYAGKNNKMYNSFDEVLEDLSKEQKQIKYIDTHFNAITQEEYKTVYYTDGTSEEVEV